MSDLDKELAMFFDSSDPSLSERPEGRKNTLFTPHSRFSDVEAELEDEEKEIRLNALIESATTTNPHLIVQAEVVEGGEEYDEDDIEADLRKMMEGSEVVRDVDLSKDMPTIERVSLDEYILINGQYTTLSLQYLNDKNKVPDGTVPICVLTEDGRPLFIRNIQPTPDVLYNMKYFLVGFEFFLVRGEEKVELDIHTFLGKVPLLEKEEIENDTSEHI